MTKHSMRDIPGSGKPEELIDAAGISARHIVETVKAIQKQPQMNANRRE